MTDELAPETREQASELSVSSNVFWQDFKKHPFFVLLFLTGLLLIAFTPLGVIAAARRANEQPGKGGRALSPFDPSSPPPAPLPITPFQQLLATANTRPVEPPRFTPLPNVRQAIDAMTAASPSHSAARQFNHVGGSENIGPSRVNGFAAETFSMPSETDFRALEQITRLSSIAETGTVEELEEFLQEDKGPLPFSQTKIAVNTLKIAAKANNVAVFSALLARTPIEYLNHPIQESDEAPPYSSLLSYCTLKLNNPELVKKIFKREKELLKISPSNILNKKMGDYPLV
jgi:hypothetical protein